MPAPGKIKFEAAKREDENPEFRTFLKCNADEEELDRQFKYRRYKKEKEGLVE